MMNGNALFSETRHHNAPEAIDHAITSRFRNISSPYMVTNAAL
jgi:chromosome condensin MukBEF ATPase and DNA-binding subunit MukB